MIVNKVQVFVGRTLCLSFEEMDDVSGNCTEKELEDPEDDVVEARRLESSEESCDPGCFDWLQSRCTNFTHKVGENNAMQNDG